MSRLDFVPARMPEAVTLKPGGYVVIQPGANGSAAAETRGYDSSVNESDATESPEDSSDDSRERVLRRPDGAQAVESSDLASNADSSSDSSSSSSDSGSDNSDSSSSSDGSDSSNSLSSSETSSEDESEDVQEKFEAESRAGTRSPTPDIIDEPPLPTPTQYYDINENPRDQGTRKPARIYKSWQASASAPVGLENRGVTCYVNAAVESLFHLPAFGRYLDQVAKGKTPFKRGTVTLELAQLFKRVTEGSKSKQYVYPTKLLRRIEDINPMLSEFEQQDSHEFYMSLLSKLQDESVPKGQKLRSSILHDMFGGTLEQAVTCSRCGHVSKTAQDFYDLPVHFTGEKPYRLTKGIGSFFAPEQITKSAGAGTGYKCDHCHHITRAVKKNLVLEAPEYLTVHLMRFKFEASSSHKVKDTMAYPMHLDLTQYSVSNEPLRYRLSAVVVHEGRTVSSGHYIAFALQPSNEWAMYDDEDWRTVPESFVRKQRDAYMLIYTKLTPKPQPAAAAGGATGSARNGSFRSPVIKPPLALPAGYESTQRSSSSSTSSPSPSSSRKSAAAKLTAKKKRHGWPTPLSSSSSPPRKRDRAAIGSEIDTIFAAKRSRKSR